MREMPPRAFEILVAAVFRNHGFDVELTPQTNDGGLDCIAVRNDPLTGLNYYLIECKRYAEDNHVGVGIVRALYGVLADQSATKGIVATTSFFTRGAKEFAQRNSTRLALVDFDLSLIHISEPTRPY